VVVDEVRQGIEQRRIVPRMVSAIALELTHPLE
jgi:hypothetical protein